ncbi:hypothetical protein [Haloarchaeobius sp. DFWS5]|uniref:hypothetical protein n=1 Tax=Haloarchaeobius sp. DFWS5 TaxID=3446114 RepID=UPI003EBC3F38
MSRRALLATMTGIGAVSTIQLVGTRASLLDVEALGSGSAAGAVDLEAYWQPGDSHGPGDDYLRVVSSTTDGDTPTVQSFGRKGGKDHDEDDDEKDKEYNASGSGSLCAKIVDGGNPSWVWLASNCPEADCGIYRDLTVTVFYDRDGDGKRDDDDDPVLFESVTLCEALSTLNTGVQLDGTATGAETPEPFEPGTPVCIGFEWEYERTHEYDWKDDSKKGDDWWDHDGKRGDDRDDEDHDGGYDGGPVTLDLHLVAEQARHQPATNPFSADCEITCGGECGTKGDGKGISWISFCTDEKIHPEDLTLGVVATNEDDEVTSVSWELDEDVDANVVQVVIKYGRFTAYRTCADGETFEEESFDCLRSGVSTSGVGLRVLDVAVDSNFNKCPCPHGTKGLKFEFDGDRLSDGDWEYLHCGEEDRDRDD